MRDYRVVVAVAFTRRGDGVNNDHVRAAGLLAEVDDHEVLSVEDLE